MPRLFERPGVQFQFPDDWTLDEEDAHEGAAAVSVYGPHGAFWSLMIHPRGVQPSALLHQVVDEMRAQYPDLDSAPCAAEAAGEQVAAVEMNFICLDFTTTAVACAMSGARATYLIVFQAEDQDFQRLRPVFDAISGSLQL